MDNEEYLLATIARLKAENAKLRAENAKLRENIESIEAIIQDDMGDWYDVDYAYIPVAFLNRAHIRDYINDLYALLDELKGE